MYNYYVEEKRKKLAEENHKIERRETVYKEKRKSKKSKFYNLELIDGLYEKYENRVKSFIIDMVHSPIKIKQFVSPVENTRKQLIEEENEKIKGRRGFVFKGFKTERQRIEEYLKNRFLMYDKPGSISKETKNLKNLPKNSHEINQDEKPDQEILNANLLDSPLLQPQMRYKARSDLERIYDAVNKNSYGRANKDIIDNQFKMLDFNAASKKKNKNEDDLQGDESFEDNKHLNINAKDEKKQKTREQIKKEMNAEAKNLMSELHIKTHFKGATSIANYNKSPSHRKIFEDPQKIKNNNQVLIDLPSLYGEEWQNKMNMNNKINKTAEFKKNFNPRKILKNSENVSYKDLQLIRNIAFSENDNLHVQFLGKNNKSSITINSTKNFISELEDNKKIEDNDRIIIDNEALNIKSQMNMIANKILRKCNVTNNKSKNNMNSHHAGDGKLMMTNGMTVAEFEKKYNLI